MPDGGPGNLFQPPPGPRTIRGTHGDQAKPTSVYTRILQWHPILKPVALGAVALGAAALLGGLGQSRRGPYYRAADAIEGPGNGR